MEYTTYLWIAQMGSNIFGLGVWITVGAVFAAAAYGIARGSCDYEDKMPYSLRSVWLFLIAGFAISFIGRSIPNRKTIPLVLKRPPDFTRRNAPQQTDHIMKTADYAPTDQDVKAFQALYDSAQVLGMGILHATPEPLDADEARQALSETRGYIDYHRGRVHKVNFTKWPLDFRLYDRDNGAGAGADALQAAGIQNETSE